MNPTKLIQAFSNVNGSADILLDTIHQCRLLGGRHNPMQGGVVKIVTGAHAIVFDNRDGSAYQALVREYMKTAGLEPDFVVGPRSWGKRIVNTPLIRHEGATYLECVLLMQGNVRYTFKGKTIPKDAIEGLQEKESDLMLRCYKADNITRVYVEGKSWV